VLHANEVLAATARVISAICVLSFIVCSFGDLVFLVLAFFDSSLLSCHFWPFTGVQNGNHREVTRKAVGTTSACADFTDEETNRKEQTEETKRRKTQGMVP